MRIVCSLNILLTYTFETYGGFIFIKTFDTYVVFYCFNIFVCIETIVCTINFKLIKSYDIV